MIDATQAELQALAGLLDAAVRWHGQVASQGGLQAHSGTTRAYHAVQLWSEKIEAALEQEKQSAE